jgi:ferredoxin
MLHLLPRVDRGIRRVLGAADAVMNRLYGWRYNPLYLSGTLTVALLATLIATGVYLLLFYRIGAPYASVARITAQPWLGRWVRGVHRYASEAAVCTALVHAIRMFAEGRRWGPRALAWVSGVVLLGLILVCGWTGYVMVWDTFGQLLAEEGSRLLDVLPLFGEPMGRAFVGEQAIPGAFFFLNLFLHIALPIGLGIGLWLHVVRVARPTLLPPRRVVWTTVGLLTGVAVAWPIGMAPEANAFRLPAVVPIDVLYAFWLPVAQRLPASIVLLTGAVATTAIVLVPLWTRPRPADRPQPSVVDERLCTGCRQCSLDCPWEAITMEPRTDGRAEAVARVDPARCVSCGICAGSCAPMGVGPPERTGRDQLAHVRRDVLVHPEMLSDVVVVACARGAGGITDTPSGVCPTFNGASVLGVPCAGNLHTSVVEYLVRAGARGVLVLACPPRDCWNRLGATWLEARMFHDREAELQARVDRRRVSIAYVAAAEARLAREALVRFREFLGAIDVPPAEDTVDLLALCDPAKAATSFGAKP